MAALAARDAVRDAARNNQLCVDRANPTVAAESVVVHDNDETGKRTATTTPVEPLAKRARIDHVRGMSADGEIYHNKSNNNKRSSSKERRRGVAISAGVTSCFYCTPCGRTLFSTTECDRHVRTKEHAATVARKKKAPAMRFSLQNKSSRSIPERDLEEDFFDPLTLGALDDPDNSAKVLKDVLGSDDED